MKLIFTIMLVTISSYCLSQDLIVTSNNDSINCQITEKRGSFLVYKIKVDGEYQSRAIKEDLILKTETNFYNNNPYLIKKENQKSSIYPYCFLNFGINRSWLTDYAQETNDAELDALYNKLSKNFSFSPEIELWLNNKIGLGMKYEYYYSKAEDNDMIFVNGPYTYHYEVKDEINIHTISPKLNFRTPLKNDNNYLCFSVMYDYNLFNELISITDKSSNVKGSSELKGKKSGFGFSAAYEHHLSKNIKLGFLSSYKFCSIDKVEVDDVEVELSGANKINLNRLNFGFYIGFR